MPILQRYILLRLSSLIRRDVSFRALALRAVLAGPLVPHEHHGPTGGVRPGSLFRRLISLSYFGTKWR